MDQNRAAAQLANKLNQPISAIKRVTIWGNHSSTQFPDAAQATCNGELVSLDQTWLETEFVPTVQKRGAAVIAARKLSSAMSAAKVRRERRKKIIIVFLLKTGRKTVGRTLYPKLKAG